MKTTMILQEQSNVADDDNYNGEDVNLKEYNDDDDVKDNDDDDVKDEDDDDVKDDDDDEGDLTVEIR